jgi:hypothetical protein
MNFALSKVAVATAQPLRKADDGGAGEVEADAVPEMGLWMLGVRPGVEMQLQDALGGEADLAFLPQRLAAAIAGRRGRGAAGAVADRTRGRRMPNGRGPLVSGGRP